MNEDTRHPSQMDLDHIWHPVMQHSVLAEEPLLMISGAEGAYIMDQEGRSYLDAAAGLWLVNIGYGRQEVVDAACEQKAVAILPPHPGQPARRQTRGQTCFHTPREPQPVLFR